VAREFWCSTNHFRGRAIGANDDENDKQVGKSASDNNVESGVARVRAR
jgi:hypothetical protein